MFSFLNYWHADDLIPCSQQERHTSQLYLDQCPNSVKMIIYTNENGTHGVEVMQLHRNSNFLLTDTILEGLIQSTKLHFHTKS